MLLLVTRTFYYNYTDPVLAQSADDALRILLGEHVKVVPRKRSSAKSRTDDKVKGQDAGSFSVRSSHNPLDMAENKSKNGIIH
jgi:hypothetical protein